MKNNKPFQFRYVNEIVGGFVLLVMALLVVAVVVAGRAQGWFETVHRIRIDFPSEGSLDLQIGSPVQILGTTVGKVELIEVDELGFMTGIITVKDDFYQFVRTDSLAVVKKKFGIAGDAFIEITKGSGPPLGGAGLAPFKDTDINELLQELVTQLRESIMPLMDSVKNTVDEYGVLAAGLSSPESALQSTLANLQAITGQVNQELETLPGTLLMTQEAILEAERLIEGIQRHWLLRGAMKPRHEPTELISLYDIRASGPVAVKDLEEDQP